MIEIVSCGFITFFSAVLIVYLDGYQALRTVVFRIPEFFWRSIALALFATICGLLAVAADIYTTIYPQHLEWLSTVLGAKIEDPYLRAIYTGLAVIAIVRSKVLQIKGADIGLEYFYGELRAKTLGSILSQWTEHRNQFIREKLELIIDQQLIDVELKELIESNIAFADTKYQSSVNSQLKELFNNKPAGEIINTDPHWRLFFRTLLNMTLTNCGTTAINRKIK